MSASSNERLNRTAILQSIAGSASLESPWYPGNYAQEIGVSIEEVYPLLNDLRLIDLIQLTEWQQGKGQGYIALPLAKEILDNPTYMQQLNESRKAQFLRPEAERPGLDEATAYDRGEVARAAYYYSKPLLVIPLFFWTNSLIFVFLLISTLSAGGDFWTFLGSGDVRTAIRFGALGAPTLAKGEWWRLVSHCFLHAGLMHIALNMMTLYSLRRTEHLWGSARFLALYLISGICGGAVAMFISPGMIESPRYVVGASGAIWGVMMSQIVWIFINKAHLPAKELLLWRQTTTVSIILNIGMSILPGISWEAHLGGGIAGALLALMLTVYRFAPPPRRAFAGFSIAMLPVAAMLFLSSLFESSPRHQGFLDQERKERAEGKQAAFNKNYDLNMGLTIVTLNKLEAELASYQMLKALDRDPSKWETIIALEKEVQKRLAADSQWLEGVERHESLNDLIDKTKKKHEANATFFGVLEKAIQAKSYDSSRTDFKKWQTEVGFSIIEKK